MELVARAAAVGGVRRAGCPMGWVLAGAGREGSTWIKAARAGRDCCSGWARDPVRWGTVLTNGFSRRVPGALV